MHENSVNIFQILQGKRYLILILYELDLFKTYSKLKSKKKKKKGQIKPSLFGHF